MKFNTMKLASVRQLLPSYCKYLIFVGLFLITAGLAIGFVSGWGPIAGGTIALGTVAIALWLFTRGNLRSTWNLRSTQSNANAVLATLAALLIFGAINFLGARYTTKFDLTEKQLFTLAPETQEVVKNLRQPVKIWIFDRTLSDSDRELLANYAKINSNFAYELVDPQVEFGRAQSFKVKSFGEVHLEAGSDRRLITTLGPETRLQETDLTNAIAQLGSNKQSIVYFLQGHGERPIEGDQTGLGDALNGLKTKNFVAKPLNLIREGTIPADASVVAIVGPQRALLDKELTALDGYLKQGGRLLALLDPSSDGGLSKLLADWGVKLDNRLVVDASGTGQLAGLGPDAPIVTRYGNHPITREFRGGISIYPVARALEISTVPGVTATPIIETDEKSWAESDPKAEKLTFNPPQDRQLTFNPPQDRQGPLVLGVALERAASPAATPSPSPTASPSPSPSGAASPSPSPAASPSASPSPAASPSPSPSPARPRAARIVAIGNSSFMADGLFGQQLNGDVLLNSVGWLGDRDASSLSIRPREPNNRRIVITPQQSSLLLLLALVVFPVGGLTLAGLMWWQRR
jgi:ABC-type uncharacterized transport system involved in gliding motility auxiliary subunit